MYTNDMVKSLIGRFILGGAIVQYYKLATDSEILIERNAKNDSEAIGSISIGRSENAGASRTELLLTRRLPS